MSELGPKPGCMDPVSGTTLRRRARTRAPKPGARPVVALFFLLPLLFVVPSCRETPRVGGMSNDAMPSSDASDAHVLFEASIADVSDPLCDSYPGDGAVAVSFGVIQQLFTDRCTSCHSSAVDAAVDGGADVDLSAGHAWTSIVGQRAPASEACGGTLVVPGNPDESYLYQKLASAHPCSGERMPRGDAALPLPDCVLALVRAWIAAGANGDPASDASSGS